MRASVIIPFYGRWDLTHVRLMEHYKHTPEEVELILIDDAGPEDGQTGGIAWWQKAARHTLRYKRLKENRGFGGAHNYGARLAHSDIFIFQSNDVAVSGDFITPICRILQDTEALVGGRLIWWPGGWNEVQVVGKKAVVPYLEGWLLACRRETWEKLGGFDPLYFPYDYEDVDLSTSAQAQGIPLVELKSPYLQHLGGGTINQVNPNRIQQTKENQVKYNTKWGSAFPDLFVKLEAQHG